MVWMVLLLVILLGAAAGGAYWYYMSTQSQPVVEAAPTPQPEEKAVEVAPLSDEQKELDAIKVEDVEIEF